MCFGIYPGLFRDSYTVRRFSAAEAVRFGETMVRSRRYCTSRRCQQYSAGANSIKKQPLGEELFSTPHWFGITQPQRNDSLNEELLEQLPHELVPELDDESGEHRRNYRTLTGSHNVEIEEYQRQHHRDNNAGYIEHDLH